MIASPPSRHTGETSEMVMEIVLPSEVSGSTSASAIATTSSPSYRNSMIPSQSNQQQQHFNIDSFDFGADFSLPTSLDELTLFHQQQVQQRSINTSQSMRGPSSSDGKVNSPRNLNFSPRNTMKEHQHHLQGGSNSRTHSPHTFSTKGDDVASVGSTSSSGNLNNVDLHNLWRAVQASSVSGTPLLQQQAHSSQHLGSNQSNLDTTANMSLSDMETYLLEKEQAERMQTLQTALLRQQLESLQRQQSSQSTESNQSSVHAANVAQMMQQFPQMTSQQIASTPTPQSIHCAASPFYQQSQQGTSEASAFQAQKIDVSSLAQYGLVTPVSSNGFMHTHQGNLPFVSPIHMPSSSQAGLMEGHRSYDTSYTPLESPAITPASVFSNIGSGGNTTTTSQDIFSPLTSPALRPQIGNVSDDFMLPLASPFLGPIMARGQVRGRGAKDSPNIGSLNKKGTTTPGVSPAIVPTKSVPRKNRSTTAEARANRARPSPLVKPTVAGTSMTSGSSSKKRNESTASTSGLASPLAMAIMNGTNSSPKKPTNRKASQTETSQSSQKDFPPLHAGNASLKSLGASPSDEEASTTPSPIDLDGNPSNKPMTPSSIMGIDAKNTQKAKTRLNENGKQVSFAKGQVNGSSASPGSFPGSFQNILPGDFPSVDRESWMSTKSGAGSGSVGGVGGGLESRRTSHKAAEQKRRDSLKYCFDELRGMLPAITLDDDAPGGSSLGPDGFVEDQEEEDFAIEDVGDEESARLANRAISKVALLRHSNEYLIRLKNRLARRDRDLGICRQQMAELRSRLGYPIESQEGGILAEYMQPISMDNAQFDLNGTQDYTNIGSNQMDIS